MYLFNFWVNLLNTHAVFRILMCQYLQIRTWQTAACSIASSPPSGVSMFPEMRWRLIKRVNSLMFPVMLRTWWKPWAGRHWIS